MAISFFEIRLLITLNKNFYLHLLFTSLYTVQITPAYFRRSFYIIQYLLQAPARECPGEQVIIGHIASNDKFHIISVCQNLQSILQRCLLKDDNTILPCQFSFTGSSIELRFSTLRIIDQLLTGCHSNVLRLLSGIIKFEMNFPFY